jgi:hypothetical protein
MATLRYIAFIKGLRGGCVSDLRNLRNLSWLKPSYEH